MHAVRATWILCAALACLAGCETVVDVPPPPHDPQLVTQAFFSPDSIWVVRVSHTVAYTASTAPGLVEDARVEVWQGDELIASPTRSDSGTYIATGRGPVAGIPYTMRVEAPGFDPTVGTDAVPPPPPVSAMRERRLEAPAANPRRRVTEVSITIDDPPGSQNFYGLFVIQARWSEDRTTGAFKLLPPTLFPFESDDAALEANAFDFLNTEKSVYREAVFADDLFDGSAYTVQFDVQYDEPDPEASVAVHRALAVVVLSLSADFYRYWVTATKQALNNDNPFAEPLRVHSNMSSGYGVFAGFQYRILPLGLADVRLAGYGMADVCGLLRGLAPICIGP